jgi:hypothetical protein
MNQGSNQVNPVSMTENITMQFLERCISITRYVQSIENPMQQNLIKWLVFRYMQYYFVKKQLFFSNIVTLPSQFREEAQKHIDGVQEVAEMYLFSLKNREIRVSDIIRDIREVEEKMGIVKDKRKWDKIPIVIRSSH